MYSFCFRDKTEKLKISQALVDVTLILYVNYISETLITAGQTPYHLEEKCCGRATGDGLHLEGSSAWRELDVVLYPTMTCRG